MQEEVNAIEELNEAEIDQVSGAGVLDEVVGAMRAVSNYFGGPLVAHTGVMSGSRG